MTFHDWINNIRWKYFTNNKAGLIFKELTKEFGMVYKMTENKRYYRDFEGENGTILRDRITNEEVFEFGMSDSKDLCDLLNEKEELIKRLKTIREEQTETILKQKRKIKELETRNKRQYNRLKELTELMYERQWGKLENMVGEWEKADELLKQEWGTIL